MLKDLIKRHRHFITGRVFLLHALCWSLFIGYELAIVYYTIGSLEQIYVYLIFYPINITFFYLYVSILNHTLTNPRKKYLKGFFLYIILLTGYLLIKSIPDYYLTSKLKFPSHSFIYINPFVTRNIVRAFNFTILGTFYWSAGRIAYFRGQAITLKNRQLTVSKEKAELETQLTKARNAYLQQKINPHLLFNALNFVYGNVLKYSDDAANCIWLLSEIMRFSLEETGPDGKITLAQEAEQINNLLAINRYRFNIPLYVRIDFSGDFTNQRIIPLLLLTFTENVFKHGVLTDPDYPAKLSLKANETGEIVFSTSNLKKPCNNYTRRANAIGLQNARIRLDAAYAGHYTLDISEPGNYYEVTLTLRT